MRGWKRSGVVVLVAVCVVAALWTWSRLRGPTPAQRAALAVLETPNAFEGRNAFDAIWVLPYDVPEADIASVADADMHALAEATRETAGPLVFTSAAARYPDIRSGRGAAASCGFSGAGCLASVSAAPAGYAATVAADAPVTARVEALSAYSHFASRLPADYRAPFPALSMLAWPMTAHAVQFVRGEQLPAIAATCRDLATMRRIGAHSDTLIVQAVATALATDGYGALLADMVSMLPRDTLLPAGCDAALAAPTPPDASVCPAMRKELAWVTGAARSAPEVYPAGAWGWLVFDPEAFRGAMAEQMAKACDTDAAALPRDRPLAAAGSPRPAWQRLECVANYVGCQLADARPDAVSYGNRALDHHARLQLLATLAWLRGQPDEGALADRLANRPSNLRSPARDITVTADGQSLQIAQYDASRGATWSLPLPPYLAGSTAGSD